MVGLFDRWGHRIQRKISTSKSSAKSPVPVPLAPASASRKAGTQSGKPDDSAQDRGSRTSPPATQAVPGRDKGKTHGRFKPIPHFASVDDYGKSRRPAAAPDPDESDDMATSRRYETTSLGRTVLRPRTGQRNREELKENEQERLKRGSLEFPEGLIDREQDLSWSQVTKRKVQVGHRGTSIPLPPSPTVKSPPSGPAAGTTKKVPRQLANPEGPDDDIDELARLAENEEASRRPKAWLEFYNEKADACGLLDRAFQESMGAENDGSGLPPWTIELPYQLVPHKDIYPGINQCKLYLGGVYITVNEREGLMVVSPGHHLLGKESKRFTSPEAFFQALHLQWAAYNSLLVWTKAIKDTGRVISLIEHIEKSKNSIVNTLVSSCVGEVKRRGTEPFWTREEHIMPTGRSGGNVPKHQAGRIHTVPWNHRERFTDKEKELHDSLSKRFRERKTRSGTPPPPDNVRYTQGEGLSSKPPREKKQKDLPAKRPDWAVAIEKVQNREVTFGTHGEYIKYFEDNVIFGLFEQPKKDKWKVLQSCSNTMKSVLKLQIKDKKILDQAWQQITSWEESCKKVLAVSPTAPARPG